MSNIVTKTMLALTQRSSVFTTYGIPIPMYCVKLDKAFFSEFTASDFGLHKKYNVVDIPSCLLRSIFPHVPIPDPSIL